MSIQLGQIAPDFEQDSLRGPIHFHDWLESSWAVLISRPKNSMPVHTTELGEVAKLRPEWDRRGVKPIVLSADFVGAHPECETDIAESQGATLDFPIIADADAKVSTLYGMIRPESDPTVTFGSVVVIDPTKEVRLILTYPPNAAGCTFAEVLRTIDNLQLGDAFDPVI